MLKDDTGKTLKQILEGKDFTPKDFDILKRALSASKSSDQHFDETLSELAIMALAEFADWITTRKRFGSIAELDASRIMKIFLDIRKDMPNVEKVADQFAIPESRAVSMLARMRYGEARRFRAEHYRSCGENLKKLVDTVKKEKDELKYLNIDKEMLDAINEAWWSIMEDTGQHGVGGKYQGAARPEFLWTNKYGGRVSATPIMWEYIVGWLELKYQELRSV